MGLGRAGPSVASYFVCIQYLFYIIFVGDILMYFDIVLVSIVAAYVVNVTRMKSDALDCDF